MKTFTTNLKLSQSLDIGLRGKSLPDGFDISKQPITVTINHLSKSFAKVSISLNATVFAFERNDKLIHSDFLKEGGECHESAGLRRIEFTTDKIEIDSLETHLISISFNQEKGIVEINKNHDYQIRPIHALNAKQNAVSQSSLRDIYLQAVSFDVDENNLIGEKPRILEIRKLIKSALDSKKLRPSLAEDLRDIDTSLSYFIEQISIKESKQ